MGLVLDSSVLIEAEREALPIIQVLMSLEARYAETKFLLSSITAMELEHGWYRTRTLEAALKRRRYLDEVFTAIPVEPFTLEMATLGAKIDAEMKKTGQVIATADLLIGITAFHHGYSLGTRNVRHFRMIPGLEVISL